MSSKVQWSHFLDQCIDHFDTVESKLKKKKSITVLKNAIKFYYSFCQVSMDLILSDQVPELNEWKLK